MTELNLRSPDGSIPPEDIAYVSDYYGSGRPEINVSQALDQLAGLVNGRGDEKQRSKIDKKICDYLNGFDRYQKYLNLFNSQFNVLSHVAKNRIAQSQSEVSACEAMIASYSTELKLLLLRKINYKNT